MTDWTPEKLDAPPDRLRWDRGDRTVVYRTATRTVTIHGSDDDPDGVVVTPYLAGAIAAAAALAQVDQAYAEVWIDDDITTQTPTNRSPWAEPIPTNPSYGG